MINGNFTLDTDSVLSLTQVPQLTTPLLTITGSALLMGTIVFNLDDTFDLLEPLIEVLEDTSISGILVPTLNGIIPSKVCAVCLCVFVYQVIIRCLYCSLSVSLAMI